jgi:hypothetical protein
MLGKYNVYEITTDPEILKLEVENNKERELNIKGKV